MAHEKKQEAGMMNALGPDTDLTVANLALNAAPGMVGNPAGLAIDLVSADREFSRNIEQAAKMMGSDTHHLAAGSPAFKKYIKDELPGIYEDRAIGYGFAIAGGAAALAIGSLVLGPPGWIVGIGLGIAGSIGAGYFKEHLFPSNYNSFLEFATELQSSGQTGKLAPEAAFVALTMNLDERAQKQVFRSIGGGVKTKRDLLRLLKTDEGRMKLQNAMVENDQLIRSNLGALSPMPSATISEQFSGLVAGGQLSGVDLLNLEKTGHIGVLISIAETEQMERQLAAQQAQPQHGQGVNPNQHLPNKNVAQQQLQ